MSKDANKACTDLFHVLRAVNISSQVGYKRDTLYVLVGDLNADSPSVPTEFQGFKTKVYQDPNPYPFMHRKVTRGDATGCAHCRWDLVQFKKKGIVPNPDCQLTQRTYAGSGDNNGSLRE